MMNGMRFGCLFGCTAWTLALFVVCLSTGRFDLLLPVALPLVLASSGLALMLLLPMEIFARLEDEAARQVIKNTRVLMVLGSAAIVTGALMLLANGILVPVFADAPELRQAVEGTGGVLHLPRWGSGLFLLLGNVMLIVWLRKLPKAPRVLPGQSSTQVVTNR